MNLPRSITPCPILEAIFEIRFKTTVHPDAIFGLVYNKLNGEFGNVEKLPILQLPENLRSVDPNLKYKPYYKISSESFIVQVGPDVLSIVSKDGYAGWEIFSKKILDVIAQVHELDIINSIERVALRYLNFFTTDVFKSIELEIRINSKDINYSNTVFRTEIEAEGFVSILQIANNVISFGNVGSVIDIDTYKDKNLDGFLSEKEEIINLIHSCEKKLFFTLLKPSFLEELNPVY